MRSELQVYVAQVESFLARVEAALGKPLVQPKVSTTSELHVSSTEDGEACLFGCFSPLASPSQPVMQMMPELLEFCGDSSLPLSMVHLQVGSVGTSVEALSSKPPLLEPNKLLDSVDRGVFGVVAVPSPESSGHVIPSGDEVVASRVLPPDPGAFFAKKLCDFLVRLEVDDPGSSKTIGCLLKEREIRNKNTKVGSCKEKSFKSKSKKQEDWSVREGAHHWVNFF